MTHYRNERQIRPVTQSLLAAILHGERLTPAAMVDFGIDTPAHFDALSKGVWSGAIDLEQLDAAIGNGSMLTTLVNDAGCNAKGVVFQTSWDVIYGRTAEQREEEPPQSHRRQRNRQRDNEREL